MITNHKPSTAVPFFNSNTLVIGKDAASTTVDDSLSRNDVTGASNFRPVLHISQYSGIEAGGPDMHMLTGTRAPEDG